jgi:membrane protease subunit HflK
MVRPQERAVVRVFGRAVLDAVPPGVHWRPPWPIGRHDRVQVQRVRSLSVGFTSVDRALGKPAPAAAEFLTGDENLINIELMAQYSIQDPRAFLFHVREPEQVVSAALEWALSHAASTRRIDPLMTYDRLNIQNEVRRDARALLDQYGSGILLLSVNIQRTPPPAEVKAAFDDVTNAREDRERITDEARGYAADLIPRARGEALQIINESQAYGVKRVDEARGDAARFAQLQREYARARETTAKRIYLESLEKIVPKMQVQVVDPTGGNKVDLGLMQQTP